MLQDKKEVTEAWLASTSDGEIKPPTMKALDDLIEGQRQKQQQQKMKFKAVDMSESLNTRKPNKSPTLLKLASFVTPKRLNFEDSDFISKHVLDDVNSLNDGLKILYNSSLKLLETASGYRYFASLELTNAEFDAKPMILILGETSAGKTTFLNSLIKQEYLGSKVGDEATTDKFYAFMSGPKPCHVSGINAVTRSDLPFESLRTFRDTFLKFEVVQMPNPNLKNLIFVDTPGIKSGQKLYKDTSYNYLGISKWFAERCRLIFIIFDSRTINFCTEFQEIIFSPRSQSHKVVVILNKVDQVKSSKLMRIYGSFLFRLGKLIERPDPPTVLCCTLNGNPMEETVTEEFKTVFEEDKEKVISIMNQVAQDASNMKIHGFIRRANSVVTHSRIIYEVKRQMPMLFRDEWCNKKVIGTTGEIRANHRN